MIVLMLLAGATMLASVLKTEDEDLYGCFLAAGADANAPFDFAAHAKLAVQSGPFNDCLDEYVSMPPAWLHPLWMASIAIVAAGLFFLLPRWRTRTGRLMPLSESDQELRDVIDHLAHRSGLSRPPRVVIDPLAFSTGAVVFGRNGDPVVRIDGGLLVLKASAPQSFEAVLLHEFAHIRNRDITITYVSVALWRVLIVLAAIPYAVSQLVHVRAAVAGTPTEIELRPNLDGLALVSVLVLLTYLARLEVLRSRELYADRAAARCGADRHGWGTVETEKSGRISGLVGRMFGSLWRSHPDPAARRKVLEDPEALFSPHPLTVLLASVAAVLTVDQFGRFPLLPPELQSDWYTLASVGPAAVLVTAVVGITLWRAVIYASLTGRPSPSGVRAGLWLGLGMMVGQVVSARGFTETGMPDHPAALLLLIPIGIALTWWLTQCARVWIERWTVRSLVPIMLLTLAVATLAMALGLAWWKSTGVTFADQDLHEDPLFHQYILNSLGVGAGDRYPTTLSAIVDFMPIWTSMTLLPLEWPVLTAIVVVPLSAWTAGTGSGPRWTKRFGRTSGTGSSVDLLPLRWMLLSSLIGAAVACVGLLFVKTVLRDRAPWVPGEQEDLHVLIYSAWMVVAVVVGSLLAAIIASALAGRYRLLVAIIAAHFAAWFGFGGFILLLATEGCHGPFDAFRSTCGFTPAVASPLSTVYLLPCLVLALAAALLGAVLVSGAHRVFRIPTRRRVRASSPPAIGRRSTRSLGVVVLCAPLIGFAAVAETIRDLPTSLSMEWTEKAVPVAPDDPSVTPALRASQISAWFDYGGEALSDRITISLLEFVQFISETTESYDDTTSLDLDSFREYCNEIEVEAEEAERYFRIPDQEAQAHWWEAISSLRLGTQSCLEAVEERNQIAILEAAVQILGTVPHLELAHARLDAIR